MNDILQTEQVLFLNIHVYTYVHVTTVNEKQGPELVKRARKSIYETLKVGKRREK